MSPINCWANFLSNEKLTPERVGDNFDVILFLAEQLAIEGKPNLNMHKDKLESRRRVVAKAMDYQIDLVQIKYKNKVAMGRGLLDAWNLEYKKHVITLLILWL